MPAKICLVLQKNSSLLGISPIIKQALVESCRYFSDFRGKICAAVVSFSCLRDSKFSLGILFRIIKNFWLCRFVNDVKQSQKGTVGGAPGKGMHRKAVILTLSDSKGELLHTMLDKFGVGVSAVLLECLQIAETAVFQA